MNPDGFAAISRRNANGKDLNRNFPTYLDVGKSEKDLKVCVNIGMQKRQGFDPLGVITLSSRNSIHEAFTYARMSSAS